jgi:hypothetical protein
MNTELNLDAEIIPNQSLGGLTLRTKLIDIQNIVHPWAQSKGSYHLSRPFEALYRPGNGEIEIGVDVRNGKVFRLTAREGYRGNLFGKVTVGMKVSEAMQLEPRLFYDEADWLIRCKGADGLSIDISEIDPPPELVPGLVISAISVYALESMTLQGQNGDW